MSVHVRVDVCGNAYARVRDRDRVCAHVRDRVDANGRGNAYGDEHDRGDDRVYGRGHAHGCVCVHAREHDPVREW